MARRWERSPVSLNTFMLTSYCKRARAQGRLCSPLRVQSYPENHRKMAASSLWKFSSCRNYRGSNWSQLSRLSHRSLGSTYASCSRTDVVVLYKWPGMRYVQLFSRVKFAQASLAALAMVPLSMGYRSGVVEAVTLLGASAGASAITIGFFWLSAFLQRFVGKLAYDPEQNTLIVSTLNFWGRRQDLTFDARKIVPMADSNRPGSLLKHLQFVQRSGRPFVYCLRYGQTKDPSLLMDVLQGRGT